MIAQHTWEGGKGHFRFRSKRILTIDLGTGRRITKGGIDRSKLFETLVRKIIMAEAVMCIATGSRGGLGFSYI